MNLRSTLIGLALLSCAGLSSAADRSSTAGRGVQLIAPPLPIAGLARERSIRIYLPPGYATGKHRYPVLYMHDGQNLFDDATSYIGEWGVDETMDALAKSDGIQVIVVGIDHGQDRRINELTPWQIAGHAPPEGQQYMEFVVGTVKPYVDRRFRTRSGPANTGIMGSSLGAVVSHYAIYQYPNVFGKAGLFSPSYGHTPGIYQFTAQRRLRPGTRLYLVAGDREGDEPRAMVDSVQRMDAQIRAAGDRQLAMFTSIRTGAQHNETFWKGEFPNAIRFLFGKR